MTFDMSKMQSSSLTPGLQDVGIVHASVVVNSQTIAISGAIQSSLSLTFPQITNTIALIRLNISGGSVGSYWFPVMGAVGVREANYYILAVTNASSTGRTVKFEIVNETVGSTVTIPTLTFTAYAHIYSFPWS